MLGRGLLAALRHCPVRQSCRRPEPESYRVLNRAQPVGDADRRAGPIDFLFRTGSKAVSSAGSGLAALQWETFGRGPEDSDRFLLVQRDYDRRWSKKMLTPKSGKPRRVDMSCELRRALLDLRNDQLRTTATADFASDLVFPSEAGTPTEMNNFTVRVFKPALAAAGLRAVRFHDLRHTFGSLLIQAGASLAYVRDQMGHSSIQVTVDIYGHLIPGANVAFVDRLDESSPRESAIQPQQSVLSILKCLRGHT